MGKGTAYLGHGKASQVSHVLEIGGLVVTGGHGERDNLSGARQGLTGFPCPGDRGAGGLMEIDDCKSVGESLQT
jgi:hypothetical protein